MRVDLTDLKLFLHIAEAGSITGGASRSHITLASASARVRSMEDTLGVSLMTRTRQGVALTPPGHTLLHHARTVLRQMERLRVDLGEYGDGVKAHIRVMCNTAALSEHVPPAIGGFLAAHPQVSVDFEERASQDIADAIRMRVCDLGIVADSVDLSGLETLPFRADPLTVVMPRDHALSRRRSLALADLADSAFVGLVEGSALEAHLAAHARRAGRQFSYRVRLNNFDAVCRMVEQGIGIGIVPAAAAARCARTMKIRRVALSDAWADRNLVLCMRCFADLPLYAGKLARHLAAGHAAT
jgi:DNA-binding transcriptional LysR family regulator